MSRGDFFSPYLSHLKIKSPIQKTAIFVLFMEMVFHSSYFHVVDDDYDCETHIIFFVCIYFSTQNNRDDGVWYC